MDEREWLACDDPKPMMRYVQTKASARKLRLFACACARRAWSLLTGVPGRRAVEVAEAFADGGASLGELRAARRSAMRPRRATHRRWVAETHPDSGPSYVAVNAALAGVEVVDTDASVAFSRTAESTQAAEGGNRNVQGRKPPKRAHSHLVRDIFGNPFRPLTLAPAVLTPTVVALARAAYEERELPSGHLDPVRLAVLADALEEVGADQALLDHLRSPGPHVRGCHVVDLLTGRK